eukprot:752807-Hanusia_phi.AAC.2
MLHRVIPAALPWSYSSSPLTSITGRGVSWEGEQQASTERQVADLLVEHRDPVHGDSAEDDLVARDVVHVARDQRLHVLDIPSRSVSRVAHSDRLTDLGGRSDFLQFAAATARVRASAREVGEGHVSRLKETRPQHKRRTKRSRPPLSALRVSNSQTQLELRCQLLA